MSDFDLIVIGSGPGGYVAAIRAAQLGRKVCVVEKGKLGGVCLNMGCIPSKALIRQAAVVRSIPSLRELGVTVDAAGLDYSRAFAASRKAADALSKGVAYLLKKNKVAVVNGTARFTAPHEISVDGNTTLSAPSIIIATGSRPRQLPGFAFDEQVVLSSDGILMLERLPKKLCILGAGAIGVEFGHIMNAFGVEVHLVEVMERVLPLEDSEISEAVRRSFVKRGIQVATSTRAVALRKTADGAVVTLEDGAKNRQELSFDKVLVVVGRTPNTDAIGLDQAGIKTDRQGFIPVHDYNETDVKGVYAIGDVVATPLLAHVASKEGEMAAEHCAGHQSGKPSIDLAEIPGAVYCEPQVASFGLTQEKAQKNGIACAVSVFQFRAAGKAVAVGETDGFVKIVHDLSGKTIYGAHLVGAQATELVHELLLAKTQKLPLSAVANMIHAHPTLSEAAMEAARMALGEAIHV